MAGEIRIEDLLTLLAADKCPRMCVDTQARLGQVKHRTWCRLKGPSVYIMYAIQMILSVVFVCVSVAGLWCWSRYICVMLSVEFTITPLLTSELSVSLSPRS